MAARDDWSSYWSASDSAASCLPDGSGEAAGALAARWADFASSLDDGMRVVDLACGKGAAGAALLAARPGVEVVGVDYADMPGEGDAPFPIRGGIDLVDLPFADAEFDAAISQYGFEYAGEAAAGELVRVLKPGGRCRLLAHHAASAVVLANGRRAAILEALLRGHATAYTNTRNAQRLQTLFDPLIRQHGEHPLLLELATACRDALRLPDAERRARCDGLEAGMTREKGLLAALAGAALDEGGVAALQARTASDMAWSEPAIVRSGDAILCWELDGTRH